MERGGGEMKPVMKMSSMGVEFCGWCERKFERGESMTAIVYNDGESAGWWCDMCVEEAKKEVSK